MKIKKSNSNVILHSLAEIKAVSQDQDKPNILYVEGYASFYQNDIGMKEVDRDQEIVNIDGMDISAYQRNPVLLWNHDWSCVVGKVISINKDGNGLFVKAEMQRLTGREADFENVLYGNVKSFSIGFIPHEYQYLEDAVEITQSEMIELSIAPVQSNRSALFQVIGTKSLDVDNAKLRTLLEPTKKEINMDSKVKDAAPVVATPVADPAPVVSPAEPAVVAPVTPEVKVEVKNEIDVSALATQIAAATAEVDRIKQEAADKAAKEAADAIEADKVAAEQKVKDALDFINSAKESILNLQSFDELNDRAEELNKLIEPITTASEAIIAKVTELSQSVAGVQPNTED